MRTLHIIGIYLQHRLGEHTGSLGGTKILISFLRCCLLSTMTYQHTTSKGSSGLTIEYIFIKFIAGTMSHLMINECIVIHHLILIGNDTTIAETFCSLALEHQVETVAGDTIMKGNHIMVHTAVGLLLYINIADTTVLVMSLLKTIKIKTRILAYKSLNNLCGKEILVVSCMVAEKKLCLSTLLQDDENTTVHHQVDIRAKNIDDLHSTLHLYILWHIDEQAILSQDCIQGSNAILVCFGNLSIVFPDEFRVFCSNLAQRIHDNALWKFYLWKSFVIESIINHEV